MRNPAVIDAAKRIFEAMSPGPVDWQKHVADQSDEGLFHSADWEMCLRYAEAALSALPHPIVAARPQEG